MMSLWVHQVQADRTAFRSQALPSDPSLWTQLSLGLFPSDTCRGALSSPQGHRGAKQRL